MEHFGGAGTLPTLRKLHQLAVWVRSYSINSNAWDEAVGLRLGIDNATRWCSWYHLLDRALQKKREIKDFMEEHEVGLEDMRLTSSDWDILSKAHTFLQPFQSLTLLAEGNKSSISQTLVAMDALLLHYEREKRFYSDSRNLDHRMLHSIEMGWFLIDKYYSKTDKAPAYAAAILLDPSRRAAYLRQNWPAEWYLPALHRANKLFEEDFKTKGSSEWEEPSTPLISKRPRNHPDVLLDSLRVKPAASSSCDDFTTFANGDPIDLGDLTPLQWWCKAEQRLRLPQLSAMAIAVLSIPAESAEPERVFSGARRTCSWDRLKLKPAKIEVVECVGSWIRDGFIKPLHLQGLGLPAEVGGGDEGKDLESSSDEEMELTAVVESL
jgi:hypothetical protein